MNGWASDKAKTTDRIRDLFSWAYAWRTEDPEGGTDLSRMRAQNRAEFDGWLQRHDREVKRTAWKEGAVWAAVELDAIPNSNTAWLVDADNPYHEEDHRG